MKLDLTIEEHRAAVLQLADLLGSRHTDLLPDPSLPVPDYLPEWMSLRAHAHRALVNPAALADLLRQALAVHGLEPCGKPYPDSHELGIRCCRVKGYELPHADCIGEDGFECVDGEHLAENMYHPWHALAASLRLDPPNRKKALEILRGAT